MTEGTPRPAAIRAEVLQRAREDGGLALLDPLTGQLLTLSRRQARGLERGSAVVMARLADAGLLEGPDAERLRARAFAARTVTAIGSAEAREVAVVAWDEAERLPPAISPRWRCGEAWRRLAEEHAAGARYLILRGLLTPGAAGEIAATAAHLPFVRLDTELVHAARHLLSPGVLDGWQALMLHPTLRMLMGAVVGRALPAGVTVNAWRFDTGDHLGVHPDGPDYCGTLSLGLSEGWCARDGGAIAFGTPRPGGFEVGQRFLPHLGDACLFAPTAETFHCVEPVVRGPRLTLTGWWVDGR